MAKYNYKDSEIDYEIYGSGKTILFLHGWSMDKRIMRNSFEPVFENSTEYRRIYFDLPGMGVSKAGSVVNSDQMLDVIYNFAKEVAGDRFIIAGESYGGYLARGFHKMHPEMILGFIFLCPLVFPGSRKGRYEPLNVMEKDEGFLASLAKEEYDSFTYMNVVLTKEVFERYKTDIMSALAIQNWDYLNNVLDGSFSFDVDALDEPCRLPCLFITGKQDTEVGYKDQFDLMRNFPKATYCAINAAGHNLQIEQPEMFRTIVKSWLGI